MEEVNNQIFFPKTINELFILWSQYPRAHLFAGGAQVLRYNGKRFLDFPLYMISLDRIDELRKITRTEQYLEVGAMVRLNDIINLGKIIPDVLISCLESIAGQQIRSIATIGGNICNNAYRLDSAATLIALDAHYELRTATSSRWISAVRFSGQTGPLPIERNELLSRIRIPLEQWDYSLYRKFNPLRRGKPGGSVAFLMRNQRNILTDIRLAFSGNIILRDRNSEILLIGKRLPLDRKDTYDFEEQWKTYLSYHIPPVDPFLQSTLLNFIESVLLSLSD